jgi:hypothetical protein
MFIREIKETNKKTKKTTIKYALVSSSRVGEKNVQSMILSLGTDFPLEKDKWPQLADRIESILTQQNVIWLPNDEIENLAQSLVTKIRLSQNSKDRPDPQHEVFHSKRLRITKSAPAGVAILSLWAINQLGLTDIFKRLDLTEDQRLTAHALIAARMEHPASELETYKWLKSTSSIGALLGINFNTRSLMSLYRISDTLLKHKNLIEYDIINNNKNIFNSNKTNLFYDLTNTYFEGDPIALKAKKGFSKEKRFDCKLESIASFIDSDGYLRKCEFYPGNVSEAQTLENMVNLVKPDSSSIIVMDKGIATSENITWMYRNGLKYLVANRQQFRDFDTTRTINYINKSKDTISFYKENVYITIDNKREPEVRLICHSRSRQNKEDAINTMRRTKYESGLQNIIHKIKTYGKDVLLSDVLKKIGSLNSEHHISKHYSISYTSNVCNLDNKKSYVTDLSYEFKPVPNSKMTHPGVYSIRTNVTDLSEQEIWETYIELTKIESFFRSLKSELGLRPIHHHKGNRIDGHLFISILAYQCVNWVRRKLKNIFLHDSWPTITRKLSTIDLCTILYPITRGTCLKNILVDINTEQKQIFDVVGLDSTKDGQLNISKLKHF